MIETTDRAAVGELIRLTEFVDVIIPRGGKSLLARLADEARVPMIMHLDGNCHMYIDEFANEDMAIEMAFHAKTHVWYLWLTRNSISPQRLGRQGIAKLGKRF